MATIIIFIIFAILPQLIDEVSHMHIPEENLTVAKRKCWLWEAVGLLKSLNIGK
jgi:hypothetical protein